MRDRQVTRVGGAVLALALCALGADEGTEPEPPRRIGLVERTERGLAQLDVTVRGPWDAIRDLTAEDFELLIDGVTMKGLVVDGLCSDPPAGDKAETTVAPDLPTPSSPAPRPPASFLFYFDQHLLTLSGRQQAIDTARRMVPELLGQGNRVAIVSSGKKLDTLADLTEDPQEVLAALQRLEGDREQWVIYPQQEDSRVREVLQTLETSGTLSACGTARRFYTEESQHTDKAMRLFALTLGQLAGLDPPKVVFYFADILRRNAGQHYLTYVGRCDGGAFGIEFAIDQVIEQAAAQGTRVYSIRAEGLVAPDDASRRQGFGAGAGAVTNLQRYSQAGDSLAGMALETGGRSFVNGESPSRIVQAVEDDLGCMYLISFDPTELPQDRLLRVALRTERPKVKTFVRGQIVLQSESARRTSRLMSAFAAPGSMRTDVPLSGAIVPTGFESGRYTAMVQIRAAGSPVPQTTWDLGASLLSRGEVKGDASARISVDRPNVPIVFEAEMTFRPGPFELVLVAHEHSSSLLGTSRVEGTWPVRDDGPAITPITVLQPADGVFVRGEASRPSGALAIGESELLRTDRPTALIGLVCRGPAKKERFTLERALVGEDEAPFEPALEIELGEEPCAQFRDVIPAGTMTPGAYTYRVRLADGDREIAVVERRFGADVAPGAARAVAGPS